MKKLGLLLIAGVILAGCGGYATKQTSCGRTVHYEYLLHPAITITGYLY